MKAPEKEPPKSLLARHRLLAPTASVYVSPLCIGGWNFGEKLKDMLGECNKETTFAILDHFYEMGGNFIDTASNYQGEESETWIGEWLAKTPGRRDEMVIASKFSGPWKVYSEPDRIQSNFGGNGAKNIRMTVEASLKKLQTSYLDLFYLHFWDFTASIPEIMQTLNHLVVAGKVIYLGISDSPAWVVVKCNEYARHHGMAQFSVYQGRWSAAERDFEREIIPMCKAEGMGLAPWGVLGGGYFRPRGEIKEGGRNLPPQNATRVDQVSEVLEKIAKKKDTLITSVALAYIMHKAPYVFPICGGRKVEHLQSNIEALGLQLSTEEMEEIEKAYDFNVGFPMNLISGNSRGPKGPEDVTWTAVRGHFDWVVDGKPISPQQLNP